MDLSEITQLPRPELEKLDPGIIKDAILREQRSTSTTVEEDKYHNRARQVSETVDGYGSLVERQEVSWTYSDAEKGVVDRITVDRGLLEKARTIIRHSPEGKVVEVQELVVREPIKEPIDASTTVHHKENTEPESVETMVVKPEEKPTLLSRALGFLRGGGESVAEQPEAQPSEEMEQLQSVLNDILGEPHG